MFDEYSMSEFAEESILCNVSKYRRSGNKINMRCPVCGDSAKNKSSMRGWFYIDTASYYCWNSGCGADNGMSALSLVSHLTGEPNDVVRISYLNWLANDDSGQEISHADQVASLVQKVSTDIPDEWEEDNDLVDKVVMDRRLMEAPYIPANWKFYYNTKTHRMVIPWLKFGQMQYFQERALYSNQTPKYKFPFDTVKDVEGLGSVLQDFGYVFWTEGCLDRIFVRNCVAVGGVTMTDNQRTILEDRFPLCELVFFPDNPWKDSTTRDIIHKRAITDPNGLVFMWDKLIEEKDINDYVIVNNDLVKFTDVEYLRSCISTYIKASVKLKFGML